MFGATKAQFSWAIKRLRSKIADAVMKPKTAVSSKGSWGMKKKLTITDPRHPRYGHLAVHCYIVYIVYYITLWLFNIAMENGPFIDDFPIKTSIYKGFSMAMLNNQMVYIYIYVYIYMLYILFNSSIHVVDRSYTIYYSISKSYHHGDKHPKIASAKLHCAGHGSHLQRAAR